MNKLPGGNLILAGSIVVLSLTVIDLIIAIPAILIAGIITSVAGMKGIGTFLIVFLVFSGGLWISGSIYSMVKRNDTRHSVAIIVVAGIMTAFMLASIAISFNFIAVLSLVGPGLILAGAIKNKMYQSEMATSQTYYQQ